MRVISRKKLREFWEKHPASEAALSHWYKVVEKSDWTKFADVRSTFNSADQVGKFVVFNVGGNNYRVRAEVFYDEPIVLIREVLTHAEYTAANKAGKRKSR